MTKEIQLTEMPFKDDGSGVIIIVSHEAEQELQAGNSITLIPPKRKVIKLSDLPDGTVVNVKFHQHEVRSVFAYEGALFEDKNATTGYANEVLVQAFDCAPSLPEQKEFTHWHGGKCPLPEGIVVEVMRRDGTQRRGEAVDFGTDWSQNSFTGLDIIAYRIIGEKNGYKVEA